MPRYLRTRIWDRPVNHCTGEARNMAPKVIMPGFSPAARARLIMASIEIAPRSAAPIAPTMMSGAMVASVRTMSWSGVNRFHSGRLNHDAVGARRSGWMCWLWAVKDCGHGAFFLPVERDGIELVEHLWRDTPPASSARRDAWPYSAGVRARAAMLLAELMRRSTGRVSDRSRVSVTLEDKEPLCHDHAAEKLQT